MAYEHRDNSGSIFQNDKKLSDRHPGWKGSAKINGVDYWVSCWVKPTQDGGKWLSLAFDEKQPMQVPQHKPVQNNHTEAQKTASEKIQAPSAQPDAPFDDELPF